MDSEFAQNFGVSEISKPLFSFKEDEYLQRIYSIHISDPTKIEALKEELLRSFDFEFVTLVPLNEITYTPNDPEYLSGDQYHIDLIEADSAWDYTEGSDTIVVAVVDVACDISHPELANKIHYNSNEIPNDGIDNDNNGFIDDYHGFSLEHSTGDSTLILPIPMSSQTHGTKVSGVIAAHTNNNLGIASVGNKIKILPIDVGQDGSSGSIPYTLDGVNYAYARVDEIDVVNCSWGGDWSAYPSYIAMFQNIVNNFVNAGVVLVGSAGNNDDTAVYYPGNLDNAIAVASSTENDEKFGSSNYHHIDIDIAAPGASFKSLRPDSSYTGFSATSAAAPIVSSVCGLMRSINPDITAIEMMDCIYNTADSVYGTYVDSLGAGRINALQCVLCAESLIDTTVVDDTSSAFINDVQLLNIIVQPNPNNGIFNVSADQHTLNSIDQVLLFDYVGRSVPIRTIKEGEAIRVETQNAIAGVHVLVVYSNKGEAFKRKVILTE